MKHFTTWIKLTCTALIWALIFYMGQAALHTWSATALGAWRFVIAALAMWPFVLLQGGLPWSLVCKNFWPLLLMAVIGVTLFNQLLFFGIANSSPVNGALIMAMCPALVTALSCWFLKLRLTLAHVVGLGSSLIGVGLVIAGGSYTSTIGLQAWAGDLGLLMACLCWAVYSILPRRFIHGMSPVQITFATISIGAVLNLLIALLRVEDLMVVPTVEGVFSLLGLSLLGVVLAFLWWQQGIARLGPSKAALAMNLTPPFAMLIGFAHGQPLFWVQWAGCILVLAGVWLATQTKAAPQTRA